MVHPADSNVPALSSNGFSPPEEDLDATDTYGENLLRGAELVLKLQLFSGAEPPNPITIESDLDGPLESNIRLAFDSIDLDGDVSMVDPMIQVLKRPRPVSPLSMSFMRTLCTYRRFGTGRRPQRVTPLLLRFFAITQGRYRQEGLRLSTPSPPRTTRHI